MKAMQRTFNDAERKILARYLREDNFDHANDVAMRVNPRRTFYSRVGKRILDVIISGLALVVTAPINLVIGVVTYFDVGRPIFFVQNRVGYKGHMFRLVKFRNMTNQKDENGNLLLPKDRVTRWGKFVRKTSLDELLNFWSVFKGDMSLIGPRPLVGSYLSRYSNRHAMRHAVRPGLECPNISNTSKEYVSKWQNQFENDVWYVENVSLRVDIKAILALIGLVFNRSETRSRGSARRGAFMGYDERGLAIDISDVPKKYIDRMYKEYGPVITADSISE